MYLLRNIFPVLALLISLSICAQENIEINPDSVKLVIPERITYYVTPGVITFIPLQLVYFGFDKAEATVKMKYIKEMNAGLKAASEAKIAVTGYTDSQGSSDYNLDLAKRRAEFVKSKLITMGIPESRIVVYSKGEESSAKGRRVEVSFLNQ